MGPVLFEYLGLAIPLIHILRKPCQSRFFDQAKKQRQQDISCGSPRIDFLGDALDGTGAIDRLECRSSEELDICLTKKFTAFLDHKKRKKWLRLGK